MQDISLWKHDHHFVDVGSAAEINTRRVLFLTAAMMVAEIICGSKFHSMALLADGWHMATHVTAFAVSVAAYVLARRHANNINFTFGTGKIGVLSAFVSAIALGGIGFYMAGESVALLFHPQPISFDEAIPIACLGLAVNVVSAILLKHNHREHHHHEEAHPHDLNLDSAYLHVMADALTSILAIIALIFGKFGGWLWLDPMMSIIGSAMIIRWSWSLLKNTGTILLDREPETSDLRFEICKAIEGHDDTTIADLHIWQISAQQFAAIVSIVTPEPQSPQFYKRLLSEHEELVHLTVEVNPGGGR
jgi:cation diffusion facilitator family transporter